MSILLFKSNRQLSDEELMQRVSRGSESAFEELYRRYVRRLQGFFFRQLGGDVDSAADFTHDVFLRIYEARECGFFSYPVSDVDILGHDIQKTELDQLKRDIVMMKTLTDDETVLNYLQMALTELEKMVNRK